MTLITFYSNSKDRYRTAVQICLKALKKMMPVSIITSTQSDTDKIRSMLWTSNHVGFAANCLGSSEFSALTPIVIDHQVEYLRKKGVLVNLSDTFPNSFSSFDRLIEIVDDDENVRLSARKRFQYFKERGYELKTYKLHN